VSAARESFFASCAPGLEPLLMAEARALKLPRLEQQTGGVYFEGTLADAARANLWLRTAVRVLMRLSRFQAAAADELYRGTAAIDWSRFLEPEGRLVVAAHSNESVLDHTLFVEQRVKDAICDQFRERTGKRPSVDKEAPDLGVHVHLFRDRCSLLVDTSGESLHKRGWRRYQGRAPLAETLAAAVVLDSGWDKRSPLVDPMCGSGTILVEAAWLALGIAPGSLRERFAFERWKEWEPALSARLRTEAQKSEQRSTKLILRGGRRHARGRPLEPRLRRRRRQDRARARSGRDLRVQARLERLDREQSALRRAHRRRARARATVRALRSAAARALRGLARDAALGESEAHPGARPEGAARARRAERRDRVRTPALRALRASLKGGGARPVRAGGRAPFPRWSHRAANRP